MDRIGAEVRVARLSRGMTQQQLADAAGVSRHFVVNLETGAVESLNLRQVRAVLKQLDLSLAVEQMPTGKDFERCYLEPWKSSRNLLNKANKSIPRLRKRLARRRALILCGMEVPADA